VAAEPAEDEFKVIKLPAVPLSESPVMVVVVDAGRVNVTAAALDRLSVAKVLAPEIVAVPVPVNDRLL
jgi:hypothetical protein